ncbi:MAG: NAD(P)H-hydrate dehydratase [Candidatus Aenigmarchaeota archaeon]|nr:NAD(P)H-hydrate dehydratase [Candidatus Aenigmarchaeota archaeon]
MKAAKPRNPWSRKGDFGHLLVIGGNEYYTGAPYLVGMAALRAGCDLVTVAAPERAADIIASYSPDIITHPLRGLWLKPVNVPEIMEIVKGKTAVTIGNGLGKERGTLEATAQIINKLEIPCVIDGDAIDRMRGRLENTIITPHAGEFERLTGVKVASMSERKSAAQAAAKELGCVILLKGHVDVVTDGKRTALNKTGNVCMTKGGTGDVLAGVTGALLCQGFALFEAARRAAYVTGKAGDIAARKRKASLLATDVIECLHRAL